MTGIAYVGVSIVLALLFTVARGRHGHEILNGCEIFRYESMWVWITALGPPLCVFALAVCFATAKPNDPMLRAPVTFFVGDAVIAAALFVVYLYARYFQIVVDEKSVVAKSIFGSKSVPFSAMRRISMQEGGKGARTLLIMGDNRVALLKIPNTIEDFESLQKLIQRRI